MVQLKDALFTNPIFLYSGSVFLGPMPGVDHLKFYIIAGISGNRLCICSVVINSNINQFILKRPHLLKHQLEISPDKYSFLSHVSYINCATPFKLNSNIFANSDMKYVGILDKTDLQEVRRHIIDSGMLTAEEIEMFFS